MEILMDFWKLGFGGVIDVMMISGIVLVILIV